MANLSAWSGSTAWSEAWGGLVNCSSDADCDTVLIMSQPTCSVFAGVADVPDGSWCSCSPYLSGGRCAEVALTWQVLNAPYFCFSCASLWCLANNMRLLWAAPTALRRSFGGVCLLFNSASCAALAYLTAVLGIFKVLGVVSYADYKWLCFFAVLLVVSMAAPTALLTNLVIEIVVKKAENKSVNVGLWSAGITLVSICLVVVIPLAASMIFLVYCIVCALVVALSLRSFSLLAGIFRTVIDEGGSSNETTNKRLIDKLRATRHYMVASARVTGVTLLTTVAALLLFKPDHKYEGSSRAAIRAVIDWIPCITMLVGFRLHAAYISEPFRERERERYARSIWPATSKSSFGRRLPA